VGRGGGQITETKDKVVQPHPMRFFSLLKWIDGRPLLDVIEPYRKRIYGEALYTFDSNGRRHYNLVVSGRAKKNWKSADLILSALYSLLAWQTKDGNQCYSLANDEGQAGDDLELAKKIIAVNPILADRVDVKQKIIERRDKGGFLEILPAQDVAGAHGKTYLFCGFDEIHGYRNWDLLEAMQLDPTRPDALIWITSYASIIHRPGVPLFDICAAGWKGEDPRMFFSWYAADKTTDSELENASPEDRANPSKGSWSDPGYLEQQQRRLPSHKYRRLHLNLPGLPEGSAYTAEMIMGAVERGVKVRSPMDGVDYFAFVDMSGGSNDDATLAIAHKDSDGRAVLDCIIDQGQRPPFDPRKAVARFEARVKEFGESKVTGDKFAGETFPEDFRAHGIEYIVSKLSKSQLYEALEPRLNSSEVILLDHPTMEAQLLGLTWRGNKIDHPANEHDDLANAVAGVVHLVLERGAKIEMWGSGEPKTMEEEKEAFERAKIKTPEQLQEGYNHWFRD